MVEYSNLFCIVYKSLVPWALECQTFPETRTKNLLKMFLHVTKCFSDVFQQTLSFLDTQSSDEKQ